MLIAQVIKRGWYIDYKVRSIDDIPLRYILHIKTIGYEKHGTDCVSYVIVRLQGMEPPHLCRSRWVSKFRERKGKGSDRRRIDGGTHGSALRFIRSPSPRSFERRGYGTMGKEGTFGRRGRYTKIIYYLNLGTIPDEVAIDVYEGKRWIGNIEEEFLARLKPNDIFVLGGRLYRFEYAHGMRCFVSRAESKYPTIPPWFSEQLPLSYELAIEIGKFRERLTNAIERALPSKKALALKGLKSDEVNEILNELPADENAKKSILQYFVEQILYARYVPNDRFILIEVDT